MFGSISAVSVALYLLDRSRRRQVVSTLRFWVAAEQPAVAARRRQHPAALVAASATGQHGAAAAGDAQLRLGTPAQAARDHVIVLDTSAWMARALRQPHPDGPGPRPRPAVSARAARARPRHAGARRRPGHAGHRFRTGPHEDRGRPSTASEPGSTALNLDQALAFARHVQAQEGRRVRRNRLRRRGPDRTESRSRRRRAAPQSARDCWCRTPSRTAGLRKIGMRRSGTRPGPVGDLRLGPQLRRAAAHRDLVPRFRPARAPRAAWPRARARLTLAAGRRSEASSSTAPAPPASWASLFPRTTPSPPTITPSWNCPRSRRWRSRSTPTEPELLRPVLSATPRVAAVYRKPEEYRANDTGLVILDRFIPPQRPAGRFPLDRSAGAGLAHSRAHHRGAGAVSRLGHRSIRLRRGPAHQGFQAGARPRYSKLRPRDGRIGEVAAGPVIVARAGQTQGRGAGLPPRALRHALRTGHAAAVRQPAALDCAGDFPPLGDQRRQRGSGEAGDGRGHRGERCEGHRGGRRRRCRSPCATARCNFFSGAPGRCGWWPATASTSTR